MTWNNENICVVRTDTGTHGLPEFNLSLDDSLRLRFAGQLSLETAAVTVSEEASPAFVPKFHAHSKIRHLGGGIIHQLLKCKELLPGGIITSEELEDLDTAMRHTFKVACDHWLHHLDDKGRRDASRDVLTLICRQVLFASLTKGAYDDGLVAMTSDDMFVKSISPVAASVVASDLNAIYRDFPDIVRGYKM